MNNNPINYIDLKGADTLNIYRSRVIKQIKGYGDEEIDVYELRFEIIKDGKSIKQDMVLYMYAKHRYESIGDNGMNKKEIYPIMFDQMSNHRGQKKWENTIRLTNFGVFAHPGDPSFNVGCKAICFDQDYDFKNTSYKQSVEDTSKALQAIRDLYNTTDQQGFFMINSLKLFNNIFNVNEPQWKEVSSSPRNF